jgi:hypothetical protein
VKRDILFFTQYWWRSLFFTRCIIKGNVYSRTEYYSQRHFGPRQLKLCSQRYTLYSLSRFFFSCVQIFCSAFCSHTLTLRSFPQNKIDKAPVLNVLNSNAVYLESLWKFFYFYGVYVGDLYKHITIRELHNDKFHFLHFPFRVLWRNC